MKIAFYAPMKPPDHPVPSGDRQMARALVRALAAAGFEVEAVSRLRSYSAAPNEAALAAAGQAELRRLLALWNRQGPRPSLWVTYHPYYRAPDLLGPDATQTLGIPYVTVEASYAGKRDRDEWSGMQAIVVRALKAAALNICFTAADRDGLSKVVGETTLADLAPFIEAENFPSVDRNERDGPVRLIAIAMMRGGAKLESYRMLARTLGQIVDEPWTLTILGGGQERPRVEAAFAGLPAGRIRWAGEVPPEDVMKHLSEADLFVWPGTGEAYGIAYLEAQACGLPAVAQATHGVPAVVRDGETGLLTPPGDDVAFAAATLRLIRDAALRRRLAAAAHRFVRAERSLPAAASRLRRLLEPLVAPTAASTRD